MDRMDTALREFFADAAAPRGLARRLVGRLAGGPPTLAALTGRFRIEANDRGVLRLYPGRGVAAASARAQRHAAQAQEELREYLAGRRAFFSVAVDLVGVAPFQARVLAEARRIPFGETESYAELARRARRRQRARRESGAGDRPLPSCDPGRRQLGPLRLRRRDEDAPARARARDAGARRLHVDAYRVPAR